MNQFADVIDWLRTPEGEQWSYNRLSHSNGMYYDGGCERETEYYLGFFSLKRDDLPGYHAPLYWGDLPGDGRLALEAELIQR